MQNLPFVLWMLGWPLIAIIRSYVGHLQEAEQISDGAALLTILIWAVVAYLVYVPTRIKRR